MQHPISLTGFIQIALVVHDLDLTLDAWCNLLHMPKPTVRTTEAITNPNEWYRGQPACYGLKFATLDCRDRGFMIELHEPDEHPSTFREFLDKHGNGVHHIGFAVGDARDAVVEELEQTGFTMRNFGIYPGGSWTIADMEDLLGVNLNIKPHA